MLKKNNQKQKNFLCLAFILFYGMLMGRYLTDYFIDILIFTLAFIFGMIILIKEKKRCNTWKQ